MGVHRKKKSTTRRLSSQTVRGAKRQRSIPRSNPSSSRTKTHKAQIPGILERITDGIVAFDAQMNYLFVNESAGQSLGRKPADLIGKNYWVEFPEAEGTPFANAYMKALKTQEPLVIEDHYAPWDRWFENRIYPSKDGLCIFFSEITERKKAEEALQVQSRFINTLANTLPTIIYVYDMETQSNVYSNDGMESVLGFTPREVQEMGAEVFARLIHPDDLEAVIEFQSHVASARDESVLEIEYRMRRKGGDWRWLHSYERPFVRNAEGGLKQKIGIAVDITERKRDELLLETEKQILEMIASDATLPEALEKIVLNIEALARVTIASVLLLGSDGLHVHYGAAPHLPKSYSDALEGAPIGPVAGSCGTALYRRETVIVTDIETDPLWDDYRTLARAHGLRACWSTPVIAFDGKVLASFAMYYRETRQPEAQDLKLIERAVHLARIAIERKQVEEALQESERRLSTLISNLPGAVYRARNDRAWATEFVSEGILHLTGYPASDFTQQRREIGDLIHPDDRERVWDDIQSALGEPAGSIEQVWLLGIIALLTLLIAVVNYVNLSTARSERRAREVGIRKTVGGSVPQIAGLLLLETSMLAAISIVFACVITEVAAPWVSDLAGKTLSLGQLGPEMFVITAGVSWFIVSLMAGAYPALVLSRLRPIHVIKGSVGQPAAINKLRGTLVVFQFAVSMVLIIGALVAVDQMEFLSRRNLGFDRDHILISSVGDNSSREKIVTLKNVLERIPGVQSASVSSAKPSRIQSGYTAFGEGLDPDHPPLVTALCTDEDFVRTMNLTLLAGPGFPPITLDDGNYYYMVNETALARFGWTVEDAIGREFNLQGGRPGRVVGVVRDFNFRSLHQQIGPLVLFNELFQAQYLLIKV